MKRIISFALVVFMLLSSVVFTVSVNASKENSEATAENIDYIDALYFDEAPTVDGYITEAEWGTASFTVEATDCATSDDTEPYSRFLWWRTGDVNDYNSWEYSVWFRWDENYFYVGVVVHDPDIHALKHGRSETWNGDAVQMRIDKFGPNAATEGQEFEVNENYTKPWSSKNVPDFLFGYVQIAGGFTEAWENVSNKGMTSFSKNPMGAAKCVVAPAGSSYSDSTQNNETTYEVGIPWAYIISGDNDKDGNQITALTYSTYSAGRRGNPTGGIGREFGISLVCLDDGNNQDPSVDAWMAWGSGICTDHQIAGAKTCTGSNSVMLSDVKVTQTAGYKTYNPTSLLDASFSQENIDKPGVFYDYIAGDYERTTPVKYEDLSVITYDDPGDVSIWGGEEKEHTDPTITDIGGEYGNVLDFTMEDHKLFMQTSYGGIDYHYPKTYTLEFDVKIDGTYADACYDTTLGNLFGGPTGSSNGGFYFCGFNFNNNRFEICNTDALVDDIDKIATADYDLKMDTWYTWRFQYDNESCTARLWLDDKSTTADDGEGWGTMIFNVCWRYFYTSTEDVPYVWRMLGTYTQYDNVKMYNFGSISQVELAEETNVSDVTGGGGNGGQTTTTVTGGGEVEINTDKVTKVDGKWHVPVEVKEEYLNATQLSFTLTYDTTKAKFDSISGLKEGTYKVEETTPGTVVVTITDFSEIKNMKAGDTMFEFLLTATDDSASVEDLNLNLTDSYVYTVTTGDSMTFVVIGGAFALALVGSVVVIRRKKETEE